MSSRPRNFRRRADGDDNDDTNGDAPLLIKPPSKSSTTTPTAASKPKKPPKLLSFADDEDNESPSRSSSRSAQTSSHSSKTSSRIAKLSSSSSHKITTAKDRLAASSTLPSNVQPQAGTYTKEALLELQKNTKTLASSRPASSERKPPLEPVIVLKGLVKPMSAAENPVIEEESVDEEPESKDRGGRSFKRDKEDTETRLASMGIGKGGDSIPDQATINAIRAKRERLRQSRAAAAPDYISLDGGSNHGAAEGLSDEEPEFQGRITMFGEKPESGKKGAFEDVDERGMEGGFMKDAHDSDDEEEKIWEEE